MHGVHHDEVTHEQLVFGLDEIARQGAQKILALALFAEVEVTARNLEIAGPFPGSRARPPATRYRTPDRPT